VLQEKKEQKVVILVNYGDVLDVKPKRIAAKFFYLNNAHITVPT
jgi:hypothetical protein